MLPDDTECTECGAALIEHTAQPDPGLEPDCPTRAGVFTLAEREG